MQDPEVEHFRRLGRLDAYLVRVGQGNIPLCLVNVYAWPGAAEKKEASFMTSRLIDAALKIVQH
eukprot:3321799-Alexandrium_andersonii.AAC.1